MVLREFCSWLPTGEADPPTGGAVHLTSSALPCRCQLKVQDDFFAGRHWKKLAMATRKVQDCLETQVLLYPSTPALEHRMSPSAMNHFTDTHCPVAFLGFCLQPSTSLSLLSHNPLSTFGGSGPRMPVSNAMNSAHYKVMYLSSWKNCDPFHPKLKESAKYSECMFFFTSTLLSHSWWNSGSRKLTILSPQQPYEVG